MAVYKFNGIDLCVPIAEINSIDTCFCVWKCNFTRPEAKIRDHFDMTRRYDLVGCFPKMHRATVSYMKSDL